MSTRSSRPRPNRLVAVRLPTRREARGGAEIVFERRHDGRSEVIYAARCYEGWQQWGASRDALTANVEIVERWRCGHIPGFMPPDWR